MFLMICFATDGPLICLCINIKNWWLKLKSNTDPHVSFLYYNWNNVEIITVVSFIGLLVGSYGFLQKWSYYIHTRARARMHMNNKEIVFKEGLELFLKTWILEGIQSNWILSLNIKSNFICKAILCLILFERLAT